MPIPSLLRSTVASSTRLRPPLAASQSSSSTLPNDPPGHPLPSACGQRKDPPAHHLRPHGEVIPHVTRSSYRDPPPRSSSSFPFDGHCPQPRLHRPPPFATAPLVQAPSSQPLHQEDLLPSRCVKISTSARISKQPSSMHGSQSTPLMHRSESKGFFSLHRSQHAEAVIASPRTSSLILSPQHGSLESVFRELVVDLISAWISKQRVYLGQSTETILCTLDLKAKHFAVSNVSTASPPLVAAPRCRSTSPDPLLTGSSAGTRRLRKVAVGPLPADTKSAPICPLQPSRGHRPYFNSVPLCHPPSTSAPPTKTSSMPHPPSRSPVSGPKGFFPLTQISNQPIMHGPLIKLQPHGFQSTDPGWDPHPVEGFSPYTDLKVVPF